MLKQSPANKKALSLKKRALALKTSDSEVKVSPTKDIPSALTRSVRLYREGKVTQAIDAVELARSEKAARYVERLKTMQILLPELKQAHRQKAGSDIVRLSPKLLSLDRKLGYGQGVIRPKLSRYYADGLYLKGLEAYSDGSFEKAYQLFRKAVQMQSSHKLSRSYLETLNRKARVLYYEAYVLKDTDKNAASKAFQQVIGMTPSSNQFHKLAKKWLRSQ